MTKERFQEIKRNYDRLTQKQYCLACGIAYPLGAFRGQDNRLHDICNQCRREGRKPL